EGIAVLHAVQGQAVRTAAPRGRLRFLLQQGDVQGRWAHEPAEDYVAAGVVREEAHEEELRWLDQGRRVQPVPRLLRRQRPGPECIRAAVRRQVRRRE